MGYPLQRDCSDDFGLVGQGVAGAYIAIDLVENIVRERAEVALHRD